MPYRAGKRIWIAGASVLLLAVCVLLSNSFSKLFLKVPLLNGSTTTVVQGVHLIGGIGPAASYVV